MLDTEGKLEVRKPGGKASSRVDSDWGAPLYEGGETPEASTVFGSVPS